MYAYPTGILPPNSPEEKIYQVGSPTFGYAVLLPLVAACRLLQNMEWGVRGKDGGRHNLKMPAYPMQGYTSVHQVVASSLAGLGDMLATNAYWFVPYDQVCEQVHTVSDMLRFFGETTQFTALQP